MKSLFKTTEETSKTSTWIIVITLLTGVSDLFFDASVALGIGQKTIAYIGLSVSVVTFVLNTLINNGVIKTVDTYAIELWKRLKK